jgi:hypothetical protein
MVMVMTIPAGELRSAPRAGLFDGLRAASHAYLERRANLAALRNAGRLGPRLLEDMGIDPETARAVSDGWDGVRLNGLLLPSLYGPR